MIVADSSSSQSPPPLPPRQPFLKTLRLLRVVSSSSSALPHHFLAPTSSLDSSSPSGSYIMPSLDPDPTSYLSSQSHLLFLLGDGGKGAHVFNRSLPSFSVRFSISSCFCRMNSSSFTTTTTCRLIFLLICVILRVKSSDLYIVSSRFRRIGLFSHIVPFQLFPNPLSKLLNRLNKSFILPPALDRNYGWIVREPVPPPIATNSPYLLELLPYPLLLLSRRFFPLFFPRANQTPPHPYLFNSAQAIQCPLSCVNAPKLFQISVHQLFVSGWFIST